MIPSGGWLATPTSQPPEAAPLPVIYSANYGDGDQGTYVIPEGVDTLTLVALAEGNVGVTSSYGNPGGTGWGFDVELFTADVFGALLVDYIDPPAPLPAIFPEEPPPPLDEALVPCPTGLFDNFEACCHVFTDWIFNGAIVFNGTRRFGGDV